MKTSAFLTQLDEARIVAEIHQAEAATSGEIRVFVSAREVDDPVVEAEKHFVELGMTNTRQHNGVLLYFAPVSQKFAVVGDSNIHERCGPSFWSELIAEMRPLLRSGRFTEAVTRSVHLAGIQLARHFPPEPENRDELPNAISTD